MADLKTAITEIVTGLGMCGAESVESALESCEQLAYANRFGNVPVHPGQEAKAPKAWRNSLASTSMKCAEE